jgi:glycosyltransferase involved in cell wall biosynthesis
MIRYGETGLLVAPGSPTAIADAILRMLRNPKGRSEMGKAARKHVVENYSATVIAPMQEASYRRAILRRQMRLKPEASRATVA